MSTCQLSFNTSLGFISIIENQGRITHIKFQKLANKKPSLQLLKAKYEIRQFLNKKRKKLTFKTNVTGSKNQLKIWRQVKKVSYGKCVSYKEISKQTKLHPRLVGKICGENRLPLTFHVTVSLDQMVHWEDIQQEAELILKKNYLKLKN